MRSESRRRALGELTEEQPHAHLASGAVACPFPSPPPLLPTRFTLAINSPQRFQVSDNTC